MSDKTITAEYEKEDGLPFSDSLTGLFSHGFFLVYLEQEMHRLERDGQPFSLAIVDIDGFGLHNARYGAVHGDRTIKEVAGIIRSNTRRGDLVARYSGDQFALMLMGGNPDQTWKAAERIRVSVEENTGGELTVSIGLAAPSTGPAAEKGALIRHSFEALKQAKIRGKNRVYWFKPKEKSLPAARSRILLVDDEPLNLKLMEGLLGPCGYELYRAENGREALYIINNVDIDLVLLDIMMPGMDGFQVCRSIKANDETRMTPVILITALDDVETKIKGIEAGADDFIARPPNKPELIARVKSLLKIKMLNSNLTGIENVLFSLANSVEAKDSYTQGHVDRVSAMALSIGKRMRLSPTELEALRLGGALHDIGKMGIPEEILNKPGPLTEKEWAVMKTHTDIGYKICLPLKKNLGKALDVIRHHHEKLDGSGYPDGLRGSEISITARIMAVADIYDALSTDRPYRKAMSKSKALEILREEMMEGKLDQVPVECLIDIVSEEELNTAACAISFSPAMESAEKVGNTPF